MSLFVDNLITSYLHFGSIFYVHVLFFLVNFLLHMGFTELCAYKSVRNFHSSFSMHDLLRSNIHMMLLQTGLEKNVFGNHPVPLQGPESRSPPPAFASEPLVHTSGTVDKTAASSARPANLDILEIDGYNSGTSSLPIHEPDFMKNTSPTGVRNFYISILL